MRRKILLSVCAMALFAGVYGIPADAAFEPELEAAYNTAVQGQYSLEGLNVSVTERTVSSATNLAAEKTMKDKGIRHSDRYIKGGYSSEVRRDGL